MFVSRARRVLSELAFPEEDRYALAARVHAHSLESTSSVSIAVPLDHKKTAYHTGELVVFGL